MQDAGGSDIMNCDSLFQRSVAALALTSLAACAGDGGRDATPTADEAYEGRFPVQADLLDDIRNAFGLGGAAAPAPAPVVSGGGAGTHGDPPFALTAAPGPFAVATADWATGTLFYPTNAQPPFAGMALCGGFLNFGPEMDGWGSFYASWGIVTVITFTSPIDLPEDRAYALGTSVAEMKTANTDPSS